MTKKNYNKKPVVSNTEIKDAPKPKLCHVTASVVWYNDINDDSEHTNTALDLFSMKLALDFDASSPAFDIDVSYAMATEAVIEVGHMLIGEMTSLANGGTSAMFGPDKIDVDVVSRFRDIRNGTAPYWFEINADTEEVFASVVASLDEMDEMDEELGVDKSEIDNDRYFSITAVLNTSGTHVPNVEFPDKFLLRAGAF